MAGLTRKLLLPTLLAILGINLVVCDVRAVSLTASDAVTVACDSAVVLRAAQDVARDLTGVFGAPVGVRRGTEGRLVAGIDASLAGPESYRMEVGAAGVRLIGADELGAVYALYDFTHRFAGVDPLWYWTDRAAPRRARIDVPEGTLQQGPPRFRFRGLFINDEDLLGQWQTPAGQRFLDYPDRERLMSLEPESEYQRNLLVFYGPIVNYDVMEAVYETVLRLHGNLIFPASFVDVMNPPEAELIRRAAARGLYVSQHLVDTMGVSFFTYLSYWKRQGRDALFSYPSEREMFHQVWEVYAKKWHELAGDKVIWQLGLRGRGDRPAWTYDPAFDRSKAGQYATDALAAQVAMVRRIDGRPAPPMTLTLWWEMSELLEKGQVAVPPDVVLVHTDHMSWPGARMNPSFDMARQPGRRHGAYLHVAVWGRGPHLVQGIDHEQLIRLVDQIAAKGDTPYAIVNASNIREHVLPLRTAMDRLWRADARSAIETSVPPAAVPVYRRLVDLQRFEDLNGMLLNDGGSRSIIRAKRTAKPEQAQALSQHSEALQTLARDARAIELPEQEARFLEHNLADQAEILAGLYGAAAGMRRQDADAGLREAKASLEAVREVFHRQQGRWAHWYAGDTKINVDLLLDRISRQLP